MALVPWRVLVFYTPAFHIGVHPLFIYCSWKFSRNTPPFKACCYKEWQLKPLDLDSTNKIIKSLLHIDRQSRPLDTRNHTDLHEAKIQPLINCFELARVTEASSGHEVLIPAFQKLLSNDDVYPVRQEHR